MKLHLGCGKVNIDGFINIDIRYLPSVDSLEDIQFLRSYSNVDVIYACHILEHFSRWNIPNVLRVWVSKLCPGGKLYLSVPDFDAIVDYYKETDDLDSLIGLLHGGQDYDSNFHHYSWSFRTLKRDLDKIGLVNIKKFDWKNGPNPDIDDCSKSYLPHMDQNGRLMVINVVGEKPN
jgi:hypothetical protein